MDHEAQMELERLFHKNQQLPRIRGEFRDPRIAEHCRRCELPEEFVYDFLTQLVLHKRAQPGVLVGLLWRHFAAEDETIPSTQTLQACADMIVKAAYSGLAEWDEIGSRFVVVIDLDKSVYEELDRYMFPPPMLVPPKEITRNNETGYLSPGCASGSILLKRNYHEDDVCLDHINRVNRVPLTLNLRSAQMVKNKWKNLDKPRPDDEPGDYQKRVKAFEKYDRCAHDVIEHLLLVDNEFYLTHRYDKRGRCYAQGYHINSQGNQWNKAMLEFSKKELVQGAVSVSQERKAA